MTITKHVQSLIAQTKKGSLIMDDADWERVNPQLSMVARVFVNRLENACVLPRLLDAADVADLKAVLVVDHYLSLLANPLQRRHVQELLEAGAPLADIASFAALSLAQELIWPDTAVNQAAPVSPADLFYPIPAAAVQLGMMPEELYEAILADRVEAQLVISQAEVEQLLAGRKGAW